MADESSGVQVIERPAGEPCGRPSAAETPRALDRVTIGFLAGIAAALFYTAANICLRRVVHCDPIWVAGVKALPTVLIAAPMLIARWSHGKSIVSSRKALLTLIAVSVVAQLLGNGLFQWALGVLGLALAVPITLGGVLIGSAFVGQWFLGEQVSKNNVISIVILITAICVLSTGAADASRALHDQLAKSGSPNGVLTAIAIFAFCVAGITFSTLGAAVRYVAKDGMPLCTILFASGFVGLALLGLIALARDPELLVATKTSDWTSMLAAGLFNAVAFWSITASLQRIRLLYVNALNVTQTAMAGVAGVVLFSEPPSPQLFLGIALTIVGVFLMDRH